MVRGSRRSIAHPQPLHAILLPEARFASDISVSVAINAIDDLPPDVYRVSIGGELIEEGRVSPEASYLAPAGVAYLPTQLRSLATSFASLGGQEFALLPTEAVVGGTFADLITMPAPELVARRIAFLVDRRQRATQNAHVGQ